MPAEHREIAASAVTLGWYDSFTYDLVEPCGRGEWLGTQKNCEVSSEATCIRLQGFVQRVGEMTSQRSLRVDRPACRLRGDEHCQLRARWLN